MPMLPKQLKRIINDHLVSEPLRRFVRSIRPYHTNHPLIRLGSDGDGGYLVPDDLGGVEACFSPGVSSTATFELDCVRRGIPCFLADYSVDAPPVQNDLIHFEKTYLGSQDREHFMRLSTWVDRLAPGSGDLLLQMDIEGAEYDVLQTTSDLHLKRFRIIVVEFHHMYNITSVRGGRQIRALFPRLLKHFDVVHIHPNNYLPLESFGEYLIPPLIEITFLRKDRIVSKEPRYDFPHPLDRTNDPSRSDYALPSCWFNRF